MKKVLLVLLIIISISCQRDIHFNNFENSLLRVYEPGDTLIFESNTKKRDTSYVLNKDVGYAKWNPFAHSGKYKYLYGTIYYGSNKRKYEGKPYPYVLLDISKTKPDSTSLDIRFKDIFISGRFKDFNKASLDKFKIADSIYKFTDVHQKGKSSVNVYLCWHIKHGVIKYSTADKEIWQRVEISKYN